MKLLPTIDSARAFNFTVTIDGIEIPYVIEVSGLKIEVDKIEGKHQTDKGQFVSRQIPGASKVGEFKVVRALTESQTILGWMTTVMEGDIAGARKTAAVALCDHQGTALITYNYTNCWVRSIEVNTLKAGAAEQITETFVVCYDDVDPK